MADDVVDPTGEAAAGTMAGEGPGTKNQSTASNLMWGGGTPNDITGSATPPPPPKESAPPASSTGGEDTDYINTLRQERDSQQTLLNEQIKAHEKFAQEMEESKRMRDEAIKRMQETMQMQPDAPPPQQMDLSKLDHQGYDATNQIGLKWQSMVGLGLAVAGMFGKHGGGIGSKFFLGSFLDSYAKGRNQAMKQQRDEWWKQVEYEHKVNEERLANYRAALQDQRFNLQQKMDLLKTYADMYGDAKMSDAASRQDVQTTSKILSDTRRAIHDYLKEAQKTGHASDYFTKSHIHKDWADAAVGKWADSHDGVAPANEQEQIEALKEYPYSAWRKDQMTYRGTDEEGNPKVVPKYPTEGQNDKHLFNPNSKVYGGPGAGGDRQGSYDKALGESIDDLGNLYGQ